MRSSKLCPGRGVAVSGVASDGKVVAMFSEVCTKIERFPCDYRNMQESVKRVM